MKSIYLFGLVLLITCNQGKQDNITSQNNSVGERTETKVGSSSLQTAKSIIDGTIGVLTYNTEISQSVNVVFFNDNGTVWDGLENDFEPFSWHPDYEGLALRCIEMQNDTCKVIVNENLKIEKKYPLENKGLVFQTWEEHILSVFSVGFDLISNPPLERPSKDSRELIHYDKDEFYHPSQIKGDWLQVKWGSEGDWKYGWIRWKDGQKLLVELYYFA